MEMVNANKGRPLTALIIFDITLPARDELERNNAKVQSILTTAQKLSATGQSMLVNSNELRRKAGTSITNLNELKQSGAALSENVKKVGETSEEIMQKSTANEDALNSLRSVNKDVIHSME